MSFADVFVLGGGVLVLLLIFAVVQAVPAAFLPAA